MTPEQGLTLLRQLTADHGSYGGAWAAMLDGSDLLRYTLAAVLRAIPAPWAVADVRMAVMTVIWPRTITLPPPIASEYHRLMGTRDYLRMVEPLGDWVMTTRLAHSHKLLDIADDGLWRAGVDVNDAPHSGLDARAKFVVAWMQHSRANGVSAP